MTETELIRALSESQRFGMLGARPIPDVIAHSESFVDALIDVHGVVIDLGTGGGVPGLVIAARRPDLQLVLVDRRQTRTDHVQRLAMRLGCHRVTVWTGDATQATQYRGMADAVVSRGFGPPNDLLAAAGPLLTAGGVLIVSNPPTVSDRWTPDLCRHYGFAPPTTAGAVTILPRM
ncbi:hypothetical protein BH24ACT5_BH24ACT5_08300 [soil metagenome]